MQPEPTPSPPLNPLEGWFDHHPTAALVFFAFSLLVSFFLIVRMWIRHRKASFLKKLGWSFVLLVPLAGWIAYGGLFHPPSRHDITTGGVEEGYFAGGGY